MCEELSNTLHHKRNAIKMTLRLHLSTNENDNHQEKYSCYRGYRGKRTFIHCWWESKLVQSLQKIVWRFLKKTKNVTTI
jgi:hypothetical protein